MLSYIYHFSVKNPYPPSTPAASHRSYRVSPLTTRLTTPNSQQRRSTSIPHQGPLPPTPLLGAIGAETHRAPRQNRRHLPPIGGTSCQLFSKTGTFESWGKQSHSQGSQQGSKVQRTINIQENPKQRTRPISCTRIEQWDYKNKYNRTSSSNNTIGTSKDKGDMSHNRIEIVINNRAETTYNKAEIQNKRANTVNNRASTINSDVKTTNNRAGLANNRAAVARIANNTTTTINRGMINSGGKTTNNRTEIVNNRPETANNKTETINNRTDITNTSTETTNNRAETTNNGVKINNRKTERTMVNNIANTISNGERISNKQSVNNRTDASNNRILTPDNGSEESNSGHPFGQTFVHYDAGFNRSYVMVWLDGLTSE